MNRRLDVVSSGLDHGNRRTKEGRTKGNGSVDGNRLLRLRDLSVLLSVGETSEDVLFWRGVVDG